jgi:transposase-like protein
VQKAELQPTDGADPAHVSVDETVLRLDTEQYRLSVAVGSDTSRLVHVGRLMTGTGALTETFLVELREKEVDGPVVLVEGTPRSQAACHRLWSRFQQVTYGI